MKKQESMTGFYYIGTQRKHIAKLVNMYKRGYASDNLQQAIVELSRENDFVPEVICCESGLGLHNIKHLSLFLSRHPRLSGIPFLLDAGNMSEPDIDLYISNKLSDDILSLKDWDETRLLSKIRFLHKFKMRSIELGKHKKLSGKEQAPHAIHQSLKRAFDIVVSMVALLFLAPILVLIALTICAESKGPVFYISKRAGKGYRIFNFYKFRTMFNGADQRVGELAHLNLYQNAEEGLFFKIDNDPRITRFGRFLRNTSLDELPQLINVLIGDMSLVGNRPLPLYEAAALTTNVSAKRFLAPAGITGLWQIKKRGRSEMSAEERIGLDIDYADNHGFLYDLWIVANTPQALIQKTNT